MYRSPSHVLWITVCLAALQAAMASQTGAGRGWVAVGCFIGDEVLQDDVTAHAQEWARLTAQRVVVLQGTVASGDGQPRQLVHREWCNGAVATQRAVTGQGIEKALGDTLTAGLQDGATRPCLLALMGHGTAAVAGSDEDEGDVWRLWGTRDGSVCGLSAEQTARAIRNGLRRAGRERVDVLVLETCYSAALEVLTEFDGLAEWVVAVPGEVRSPGLAWKPLAARLGSTDCGAEEVAKTLVLGQPSVGSASASGGTPWSLSVCDMGQLSAVLEAFGRVSQLAGAELETFALAARWAESRAALGERLVQAADLADLATGVAAYAKDERLRQAAAELRQQARRLVAARAVVGAMPEEAARGMAERCGVTVFVPPLTAISVTRYVQGTQLAKSTRYGPLLEQYMQHRGAWNPLMP